MEPKDIIAFITALIVATTFYLNVKFQRQLKSVDTVGVYRNRYDELRYEVAEKVPSDEPSAKVFWRRFWNLQLEQFDLWLLGFIPERTYISWIRYRLAERDTWIVGGMTSHMGWEAASDVVSKSGFNLFMTIAYGEGIDAAVKYARKNRRQLLK